MLKQHSALLSHVLHLSCGSRRTFDLQSSNLPVPSAVSEGWSILELSLGKEAEMKHSKSELTTASFPALNSQFREIGSIAVPFFLPGSALSVWIVESLRLLLFLYTDWHHGNTKIAGWPRHDHNKILNGDSREICLLKSESLDYSLIQAIEMQLDITIQIQSW